jgi:hypothetical protein
MLTVLLFGFSWMPSIWPLRMTEQLCTPASSRARRACSVRNAYSPCTCRGGVGGVRWGKVRGEPQEADMYALNATWKVDQHTFCRAAVPGKVAC